MGSKKKKRREYKRKQKANRLRARKQKKRKLGTEAPDHEINEPKPVRPSSKSPSSNSKRFDLSAFNDNGEAVDISKSDNTDKAHEFDKSAWGVG